MKANADYFLACAILVPVLLFGATWYHLKDWALEVYGIFHDAWAGELV